MEFEYNNIYLVIVIYLFIYLFIYQTLIYRLSQG